MRFLLIMSNVLICLTLCGQIGIGEYYSMSGTREVDSDLLREFKETKTIFISRYSDRFKVWEEELTKNWNITPIEIVAVDDLGPYLENKEKYSFIEIQGEVVSSTKTSCTYLYLNVYLLKENKKGKWKEQSLAKYELFPDPELLVGTIWKDRESVMNDLYGEGTIYNWHHIFVINFVTYVNTLLQSNGFHSLTAKYSNESKLSKLNNKTLYIPKYTLNKYNAWTWENTNDHDVESLFKDYEYKYEIISEDDLFEKYKKGEEVYYLLAVKSCNRMLISIVNNISGEVIYTDSPGLFSYNLKKSHLKDISKRISKALKKSKK